MIKTILWDVDGTLLDFLAAERNGIRHCFRMFGLGECTDEMLAEYSRINVSYWQRLERGEMTKPEILVGRFREFFGRYGLDQDVVEDFNHEYQSALGDTVCFHEHALETVQLLKGKVLQCAATNGTKVAQTKKLGKSGLDQLFDHLFISEDVGFEKPSKEYFDVVFRTVGCSDPSEMMIVGDSLTSDMQGGVNAGIITCWYNPSGKVNTKGLPIDYEIRDLADVPEILNMTEAAEIRHS